jgi:uncharacterized membrane protein (UPF0127 family)
MKSILIPFLISFFLLSPVAWGESTAYRTIGFPNGLMIKAEVADTPAARERGLMLREGLSEGAGMLFIFSDAAPHQFWTKNCLFAMDMIWLDGQRQMIYFAQNVPPCKADPCPQYGPKQQEALYVIETAGGFIKKNQLTLGAKVKF